MTITRAQTRAALVESIEHWKRNEVAETPGDAKIYSSNCPLCHLFPGPECEGCPVSEYTAISDCDRSPWVEVNRFYASWKNRGNEFRGSFRTAAEAEREFLEMLLAKHDAEGSAQ